MGNCDTEGHHHGHHGQGDYHGMSDDERFDRFFDGSFKRYRRGNNECFYKKDYIVLVRDLCREFNLRYIPEDRIIKSWESMTDVSGNMFESEYNRNVRPELKRLMREYR